MDDNWAELLLLLCYRYFIWAWPEFTSLWYMLKGQHQRAFYPWFFCVVCLCSSEWARLMKPTPEGRKGVAKWAQGIRTTSGQQRPPENDSLWASSFHIQKSLTKHHKANCMTCPALWATKRARAHETVFPSCHAGDCGGDLSLWGRFAGRHFDPTMLLIVSLGTL